MKRVRHGGGGESDKEDELGEMKMAKCLLRRRRNEGEVTGDGEGWW